MTMTTESSVEELRGFVIGPIGQAGSDVRKRADLVLHSIIKPDLGPLNYTVTRADDITNPGQITPQVITFINSADLVIADLTGHNPNVFYELAIADALEKPVMLIAKDDERLPFDISHYRAVTYCDSNLISDTSHNVITNLRGHAESTLGPSFRVSNPVTDAGFSRPWINRDQLRKLEKRRNEGGILFDGEESSYHGIIYVFVKSLTPIESEQEGFASHVMNNIRKNVRYRYFFKDKSKRLVLLPR